MRVGACGCFRACVLAFFSAFVMACVSVRAYPSVCECV